MSNEGRPQNPYTSITKETSNLALSKEVAVEKEESNENIESKVVQELSRLISTNPDFVFGVSANGRLSPNRMGSMLGQKGYVLDQKTNLLKELNHTDEKNLPNPIIHDDPVNTIELYKPTLTTTHTKLRNGDSFNQYQSAMRVKFVPGNPFTSDARGPIDFQGGLFVRHTTEAANSMSKELLDVINQPQTPQTRAILWKLLAQSFEKYTPEYWAFITQQWQSQPENQGKDIRDYFSN